MLRLALILHIFIGATLGGVLLVVALLAGYDTLMALIGAVLVGFVIAIPVAGKLARVLTGPS